MLKISQEKRAFYKLLLTLSIPLIIQNLIDASVNLADTLMLGMFVGTEELSAANLANQIQFVLHLFFFGICSGSSVIIAQYWGKGDIKTIERTLGIALRFSLTMGALLTLAALLIPETLMKIYTNDPDLIAKGTKYLRIVGLGYLTSSFVAIYVSTQRATERVMFGTIVNASCLLLNVILNACFIFGFWFFPKLDLAGVALATLIARVTAFVICVLDAFFRSKLKVRIAYLFARNRELMRDFVKYTLPALGNDIAWGMGFSAYTAILGRLGASAEATGAFGNILRSMSASVFGTEIIYTADVVAANTYANVARQLGTVICFAAANAAGIIMGKTMGENRLDDAKEYGRRFMKISIITGLAGGAIVAILAPFIYDKVGLTAQAAKLFRFMLAMSAFSVLGQSYNTMLICGVYRAGGDTKFGFKMDATIMWGYGVLFGSIAAFLLKWPVEIVYLVLFMDEFVKMPFVGMRYIKFKWLKNITRDFD